MVQYGVKCIQYMGATLWSNLPVEFRNSTFKFIFSTDLKIPLCKTSKGQRSFSYRGVAVWNQLRQEIKTAPSLATFKTKLKKFLKGQRRQ